MTITLYDVSCILSLLIYGCLLDHPTISIGEASEILADNIGGDPKKVVDECHKTRGAHVRFKWLGDQYRNQLALAQQFEDEPIREIHKINV